MSIRDADMKDMNDYIRAYSQMEPLLNDYDKQLQRITDLYNEARERDRRLLRVERLYRKPHLTNWESMSEILDITRALNRVLRQETSTIHNMALLPESERMQFWHEQFLPLEAQEKALRPSCSSSASECLQLNNSLWRSLRLKAGQKPGLCGSEGIQEAFRLLWHA